MAYIGKSPGTGVRNRFIYTATASQTTFSGSDDHSRTLSYTDAEFTDVFLNGVKLDKSDYTATSGTSIVLGSGATAGDNLEVLAFDTFSVFSGDFSQDVTVGADLTVDTSTLVVDSTNNRVGVGVAAPDTKLHVLDTAASTATHSYTKLHIEDSDHLALQFSGGTGGEQWIWFADDSTSTPVGGITYYHGGPYMGFRVEGSERLRIQSGGGISFNGDTAAANALDDYEEGTWTPTYSGSTSSPTVSYTEQHGEYVKIGRQVIARLELKTSSVSGGSGVVTVGGLPFAAVSNDGSRSGNLIVGYSQGFASNDMAPQTGYANDSTTSIVLGHAQSSDGSSSLSGTLAHSDLASSGNNFLMATLIYTAA